MLLWQTIYNLADRLIDLCNANGVAYPGENAVGTLFDILINLSWLRELRDLHIPYFLCDCLDRLFARASPAVIGFSCYMSQVLPALALGRLIRQRRPEI
jgi:hypothetical protein